MIPPHCIPGTHAVEVNSALLHFLGELYPAPRTWTERAHPKLIHYNWLDNGGHFACWEQPEHFCQEIRAGFPDEVIRPQETWARRAFPDLILTL